VLWWKAYRTEQLSMCKPRSACQTKWWGLSLGDWPSYTFKLRHCLHSLSRQPRHVLVEDYHKALFALDGPDALPTDGDVAFLGKAFAGFLGLPEHGAAVLFWANPNIDQPRLLLPRGVPGSASFEVSPDNADLLDSLVASCVQYCCPTDCPCEEGHMSRASLKNIWSQLPAWGALMVAFGALLAGDARADRSQLQPPEAAPEPSRLASRLDQVAIRIDGENIYISQRGSAFEELRLGDTPDAAHLRKLLRDAGAEGQSVFVPIGAMIVASGGGSGKGEKPKQKTSKDTTDPGKGK